VGEKPLWSTTTTTTAKQLGMIVSHFVLKHLHINSIHLKRCASLCFCCYDADVHPNWLCKPEVIRTQQMHCKLCCCSPLARSLTHSHVCLIQFANFLLFVKEKECCCASCCCSGCRKRL